MAHIRIFEKSKTVAGDISAPVYAYIGESGSGKDRRIKLEGATLFDKMLKLYNAGTYVSIGPAEGSREWNKLDTEDQGDYRILQARAKKKKTYKQMGDFLSDMCSANECFLFAIRQGDDAVWVNPKALKELLDNPWRGVDSVWLDQAADVKGYWDKVVAARDAGKNYSKIKPENRNEDHGSELLTVIDAVELADEVTAAGRPFYIDTDHEVENGLDVWAVDSKTGDDYPRSWRVMNDLSVLVFNTDKKGNADLIEEKSFEDIHELGEWLVKEFNNLAGKNEADEWDEDQYAEWALNDIGDQVSRNWDRVLNAIAAEYPGATLSDNIETKVTYIHPSKKKVFLEDTRKVTVPVDFDPKHSEADATEHVLNMLSEILDGVEYEQGQLPRRQGSLEYPEVMFDDVDLDGNNIIVPLKFSYVYKHSED